MTALVRSSRDDDNSGPDPATHPAHELFPTTHMFGSLSIICNNKQCLLCLWKQFERATKKHYPPTDSNRDKEPRDK